MTTACKVLRIRQGTITGCPVFTGYEGKPSWPYSSSPTMSAWGWGTPAWERPGAHPGVALYTCSQPVLEFLFPGLALKGLRSTSTWRKPEGLQEWTLRIAYDLSSAVPSNASVMNCLLYCILFICLLTYCTPTQSKGCLSYKFWDIEIETGERRKGTRIKDENQKE